MCGIAGIYCFREGLDLTSAIEAMLSRIARRGPDDGGVHSLPGLALGHRRLSILDLSSAGHQPMVSGSGRYAVSFNGEIYNYADLRKELDLDSSCLRSRTDTEILLAAWERWGEAALPRFVGQWAFAIYDKEARRLWLARDRVGEKTLFYHLTHRRL